MIEMTAVVFVIGLMAAVAMPAIGTYSHRNIKEAAREMSTALKALYAQSALDGQAYRLVYEFQTGEYHVEIRAVSGSEILWNPAPGVRGFSQKRKLPDGVRFKEIQTLHDESPVKKGKTWSELSGTGFVEPTVIHLADEGKKELTLQVMPMTGTVRIFDGYMDFKK